MKIFLTPIAKRLFKTFGIVLFPWSIFLVVKQCCKEDSIEPWNAYWYEVARGWDILANKSYAPALNKEFVKKNGRQFGGDQTISQCMAINKYFGYDTSTARWWEKRINYFDKDHLKKTYDKINLN